MQSRTLGLAKSNLSISNNGAFLGRSERYKFNMSRGSQRALRLPIGINLSKHKLLIFYIFLLATLHECNFLAILGCP